MQMILSLIIFLQLNNAWILRNDDVGTHDMQVEIVGFEIQISAVLTAVTSDWKSSLNIYMSSFEIPVCVAVIFCKNRDQNNLPYARRAP